MGNRGVVGGGGGGGREDYQREKNENISAARPQKLDNGYLYVAYVDGETGEGFFTPC